MLIDHFSETRRAVEKAVDEVVESRLDSIPTEFPPDPSLGDLATPAPLAAARVLKRAPREIAERVVTALGESVWVDTAEVAGPGFVNVRVDRSATLRRALASDGTPAAIDGFDGKTIVEHTNINPNKAAHIGHLRNAILGDTLVRALRSFGLDVEIQNYIDDTGVQVADVLVGLVDLEALPLEEIDRLIDASRTARRSKDRGIDDRLWDVYARVTAWFAEDRERLARRAEVLHVLEAGEGELAAVGRRLAAEVARCHLRTMGRIGVEYDLLPKESDILGHSFWDTAFERLKSSGAISLAREGKAAGCWIMTLPHDEEGDSEQEYEKIIVRSNGTVTYVGKDIAYQLWKFGLLGADFDYAPLESAAAGEVLGEGPWESVPPGSGVVGGGSFGRGARVYNVIDVSQSYLQQVVQQGLLLLGHTSEAERSIHFAYEKVALSPKTAKELRPGLELSPEEAKKPWLDMSGRKGLGVKADDLIDRLERKARVEVDERNPDLSEEERKELATKISVGALRYYMLRFARTTIVAFDVDAALAFEGETGPYCQYAAVRIGRIVEKLSAALEISPEELRRMAAASDFAAVPEDLANDHWKLVHAALRLPDVVRQAVEALELATLAKYVFELAQQINGFYHRFPVLKESDPDVRMARLACLLCAERSLVQGMDLMGVPVPARM